LQAPDWQVRLPQHSLEAVQLVPELAQQLPPLEQLSELQQSAGDLQLEPALLQGSSHAVPLRLFEANSSVHAASILRVPDPAFEGNDSTGWQHAARQLSVIDGYTLAPSPWAVL
jgi:hypothetical protein